MKVFARLENREKSSVARASVMRRRHGKKVNRGNDVKMVVGGIGGGRRGGGGGRRGRSS